MKIYVVEVDLDLFQHRNQHKTTAVLSSLLLTPVVSQWSVCRYSAWLDIKNLTVVVSFVSFLYHEPLLLYTKQKIVFSCIWQGYSAEVDQQEPQTCNIIIISCNHAVLVYDAQFPWNSYWEFQFLGAKSRNIAFLPYLFSESSRLNIFIALIKPAFTTPRSTVLEVYQRRSNQYRHYLKASRAIINSLTYIAIAILISYWSASYFNGWWPG